MNTELLLNNINHNVEHINKMLDWVKIFKKNDINTRSKLIDQRRKLNKIKRALEVNPAASIYGESQVGKSYLVDNLLSDEKGSLKIIYGNNQECDYISECNPIGGGTESTGVVTRFTSTLKDFPDGYDVVSKLISVKDIILILVDAYFNDITHQSFSSQQELIDVIHDLKLKYQTVNDTNTHVLTEDDLYDIRDYFLGGRFFKRGYNEAETIAKSGFFEELSLLINRIPIDDWGDIFSVLWGKLDFFTDIYKSLFGFLKTLNFEKEVYVPLKAVKRLHGTILDVSRIRELFDHQGENVSYDYEVEVMTSKGKIKMDKRQFSVLIAELVFRIKDSLLKSKPFLKNIDLLDFPGARSRLDKKIEAAQNLKSDLILRGKVAYLFNNFTESFLINNLLFCHHDVQSEVSSLSDLLNLWVDTIIGGTLEERELFIEDSKISPLFIVGTKFNKDLERTSNDEGSDESKLLTKKSRWEKRFDKVLSDVLGLEKENKNNQDIKVNTAKWFNNWTNTDKNFSNLYLLRSYDFSDRNGIFTGYNIHENDDNGDLKISLNIDKKSGLKVGEKDYGKGYQKFISELKNSFIDNDFVKKHFNDPSKSWDEASSIGKDGSAWIIENLSISSQNTLASRNNSFERQIKKFNDDLKLILSDFFHDDNSDLMLKKAMAKSGKIEIQLDTLFGRDRFFFSQFISRMLISESKVHDLLLHTINDVKMIEDTDTSEYFAIRTKTQINPTLTDDENIELIRKAYNFSNIEEVNKFLEIQKIKLEDLIKPKLTRNFASIITDVVVEEWFSKYLINERYNNFIERGFQQNSLEDLLTNMRLLFKDVLNISEMISNKIRNYVINMEAVDTMVEMLADISSEMINKFVNEMGYSYYTSDKWDSIKVANQQNNLDLNFGIRSIEDNNILDNSYVENVFDVLDNLDEVLNEVPLDKEKIKFIPNYTSFEKWTSLMKISFVAACNIPTYNRLANEQLGVIIDSYSKYNLN